MAFSGVGVDAAEVVGAREGPEEARPDEPDDRELRHSAVRKLGLAHVQGVVEAREGGRGKADGIESDVAGEGAAEGVEARSEWQGLGPLDEVGVEGGGGLAGFGGGKSGGGPKEGCDFLLVGGLKLIAVQLATEDATGDGRE